MNNNFNESNNLDNNVTSGPESIQPEINNELNTQNTNIYATPNLQNQTNNVDYIAPSNNINYITQNNIENNNINQSTTENNNINQSTTENNEEYLNNTITDNSSTNDDELLKAFIGSNYEKITTKQFNFAGFFFTTFYMFYRKMFLLGILSFIISSVLMFVLKSYFIISILYNILIGFMVNKLYLYHAKKKIDKIKLQNEQKSNEELINICKNKGGTNIGFIFLGFLVELGITIIFLIIMFITSIGKFFDNFLTNINWNITQKENIIDDSYNNDDSYINNTNDTDDNNNTNDNNNSISSEDKILEEDVEITGYACFASTCTMYINDSNGKSNYILEASNKELIKSLKDYKKYVKLDIYYIKNKEGNTILDYKAYLKTNNEDISNITNENELRTKIGLYAEGTHTATFIFSKTTMADTVYLFIDDNSDIYEMKYNNSNELNLIEGNKYNITFEVKKEFLGYEFYIKNVN